MALALLDGVILRIGLSCRTYRDTSPSVADQ